MALTIEIVVDVLTKRATCRGDLLGVMPEERLKALNFIKRNVEAIELAVGRKLRIVKAEYVPSGCGAFGCTRYGGKKGRTINAGVYWKW